MLSLNGWRGEGLNLNDILRLFRSRNPLLPYATWRESYLTKYPEKRFFPWFRSMRKTIEEGRPEEPIVTLEKKGKLLLILGLVLIVAMAGAGHSKPS